MLPFSVHLVSFSALRRPTGNITVKLSNGCWGHVSVCLATRCGGVCKDAWSHNLSSILCQSLSCGQPVQPTGAQDQVHDVLISSVHTTAYTRSLSQSAMLVNNGSSCANNPAYVVCSGNPQPLKVHLGIDRLLDSSARPPSFTVCHLLLRALAAPGN